MEFQCYYPNCPRSYNSKYNLKRHINTNHLNLKTYPCEQCEKTFASKKNLSKHTSTHSEIVFEEIPMVVKAKNKSSKGVYTDIRPFSLTNHYKDPFVAIVTNPVIAKQSLPSLPPVDFCRQSHQGAAKIPLIPILLNYANRN